MSALTTGRGASHAQSSLTSFLSRKRGSPFLKKGSPKALRAFPPVQNLRAKKRMFFSGSRKGSLLKRTAELWGFRLRFACQKPHISCVQRAVRGSAPKPRRLLEKADENFRPLPRYRRRRNAHRKLFTLYNDPYHLPAPCGLAK